MVDCQILSLHLLLDYVGLDCQSLADKESILSTEPSGFVKCFLNHINQMPLQRCICDQDLTKVNEFQNKVYLNR